MKKMKYLILVRHGEPDNEGNLSVFGQIETKRMAGSIKELGIESLRIKIVSSPKPRAEQTAKHVVRNLGLIDSIETIEALAQEIHPLFDQFSQYLFNLERTLLGMVKDCDILIVVTHLPQVEYFVPYYSKVHFPRSTLPNCKVGMGEGIVIDHESRTIARIPT